MEALPKLELKPLRELKEPSHRNKQQEQIKLLGAVLPNPNATKKYVRRDVCTSYCRHHTKTTKNNYYMQNLISTRA